MHNLLFFAHTVCLDYVIKTFLSVSSSGIAELPTQNCRERKNSFRFQFVERGNGDCLGPCGMAKESVRPNTHLGLWP